MQYFVAVGVSLPKEVIEKIDTERGDVSRSRYILRKLQKEVPLTGHQNSKINRKDLLANRFVSLPAGKSPSP